jgi:YD repeat-containing protein
MDGSFQYEEGETIRFTIGATYLGEVMGKEQVISGGRYWKTRTRFKLSSILQCCSTALITTQTRAMALGNLYSSLGIDPRIYGLVFKREENQDGISTDRFEYDQNGNAIRHETSDFGGAYETSEYDADGNVTRREFINTRDDVVEEIVTWQYDEIGNVIQKDVWSTSPTGEYYSLETWQYHTDNALKVYEIEETQLSVEAEELEEEKEVRRRGYRYDANGNLLQYEEPGVERKAWEYDAGGKLVREQVEIEAEGRYTQFWEYDAEKIVKRNLVDEGGDGSIDVTTVFQYQPTEWGILFSSTQRPVFLNPRPDVEQLATTGF